jgi:hypothetical protein
MKVISTILVIFTSYTINCQTSIDTLPNGKVVICFDVTGANEINLNFDELIYLRKNDSLQAEQKQLLKSVLDSCEKQRANDVYRIDTFVNICKQLDERYKVTIQERGIEQKELLEYKRKNVNKNWALISLVLVSILGFVI